MIKIYKLVHPERGVVYIGQTKQPLKRRKQIGYPFNIELQSIKDECEIILIEETDDISKEKYWIDFYVYENLLNIQKGNGFNHKDYQKEYHKDYQKGAKYKDYQKDYIEKNKDKVREWKRNWARKNRKNKTEL